MGSVPYMKIVPYRGNIRSTLSRARALAKAARRPKKRPPRFKARVLFDTGPSAPVVVNDIFERATGILEIVKICDEPYTGSASPLNEAKLLDLFGTTRPGRDVAESSFRLADQQQRGKAVCFPLFHGDVPSEIMFVGCSSGGGLFSVVVPYVADTGLALENAKALVQGRPIPDGDDTDGTASILDILIISDEPAVGGACPLKAEKLLELFGTTKPTREMAESKNDLFDDVGRGEGRYIVLHEGDAPMEVMFYGYSVD